jgi:hypothetical protein
VAAEDAAVACAAVACVAAEDAAVAGEMAVEEAADELAGVEVVEASNCNITATVTVTP